MGSFFKNLFRKPPIKDYISGARIEKMPIEDALIHYGVGKMDGAPGRGSGRYPLGSGENPNQHSGDFLSRIQKLQKEGLSETEIAKAMGLTTTEYRAQKSLANAERRALEVATAKKLREEGYSLNEIAEQMGYNSESSIRSLLNPQSEARMNEVTVIADKIKAAVDEKGMIDVGVGVERELGTSKEKLTQALRLLENEGYNTFGGRVPQVTNPGKYTTLKVICPPGTPYKVNEKGEKTSSAIYDFDKISSLRDYISGSSGNTEGNTASSKWVYPASMDSSRISICYGDEGGAEKDGVIEIRRGVADLSLGESHYAQVRILVDGTHYIKGMAIYSDNIPEGKDLVFNTNKKSGTAMTDVLKKIKDDPDNPFGALLKEGVEDPDSPNSEKGGQSYYYDENGEKQLSLINKTRIEGDWDSWSDSLPSQFLAKQSQKLIDTQLNMTIADKKAEYEEICSLTNPTVKKVLLQSFANDCDSAAVHLKAAALPNQSYQVILPLTTIKDTEVYAPNYKDGETVALVRFPHGGTFEIPILTVNTKLKEGKSVIGNDAIDAIGISPAVAARLSGADFDGDTVMVIPCNSPNSKIKIQSTKELEGLKGFEPKNEYGCDLVTEDEDGTKHYYQNGVEFRHMSNTQTEMGKISNLITDMTLLGAKTPELVRAVKHSMVVIDAEKHHLNYKQSEIDNDIASLKKLYQKHTDDDGYGGSATLISRAKSETSVPKTQGSPKINLAGTTWYDSSLPEGALIYKTVKDSTYNVATINRRSSDTNATVHINAKGTAYAQLDDSTEWLKINGKTSDLSEGDRVSATIVTKDRLQKSNQMTDTQDAMTLVSVAQTPAELAYANYANQMKSLANQARKELMTTGNIKYDASARSTYQAEVTHLNAQLNVALKNAPRERTAQLIANSRVAAKVQSNPDMTKKEIKKASQQALTAARAEVGASHVDIKISDKEWEAIQAGAISENQLMKILNNTNLDDIKERATPKTSTELSTAQISMIKSLAVSGYTIDQIAEKLNRSKSTIRKYLK